MDAYDWLSEVLILEHAPAMTDKRLDRERARLCDLFNEMTEESQAEAEYVHWYWLSSEEYPTAEA